MNPCLWFHPSSPVVWRVVDVATKNPTLSTKAKGLNTTYCRCGAENRKFPIVVGRKLMYFTGALIP